MSSPYSEIRQMQNHDQLINLLKEILEELQAIHRVLIDALLSDGAFRTREMS